MVNLRQKFVKGVFWSAILSWGRQAINFIVFLLLARMLEPEAFGLMSLAALFLAFLQLFLDQGFSSAIVQRQELETEHLNTAFWTNIGIGLLMTLTSIAGSGTVANLFKEPDLSPILCGLSLSFVLSSLGNVHSSLFKRKLNYKYLTILSLVAIVTGGVAGVVMALMNYGVWSLVVQQLTNNLVQVLALWLASPWRPQLQFSVKHFRELFSFGINVVGIKILDFANRRSDDLLIGYFLGSVELGYYTVAYRILLSITQLFSNVTTQVAMPVFSKLQEEPERLRNAFYRVTRLTSLIAFPVFFGMNILAHELIVVMFGEQWLPSVPVMRILAFIGIIHSVNNFNGPLFFAMGKPDWKFKLNLVHAIANVVGFVIAVRWGIVAVASVYVIRSYLLTPIDIFLIRRLIQIKLSTYMTQYLVPIIGSLGMTLAIWTSQHYLITSLSEQLLLVIHILIGIFVYGAIIFSCQPQLIKQLWEVVNLVTKTKVSHNNQ